MRTDGNHGREKNYEPNSFGGPQQTGAAAMGANRSRGLTGNHVPVHHRDDNDFVQAGDLYRLMSEEEKQTTDREHRGEPREGQQTGYHRAVNRQFPQGRYQLRRSSRQGDRATPQSAMRSV